MPRTVGIALEVPRGTNLAWANEMRTSAGTDVEKPKTRCTDSLRGAHKVSDALKDSGASCEFGDANADRRRVARLLDDAYTSRTGGYAANASMVMDWKSQTMPARPAACGYPVSLDALRDRRPMTSPLPAANLESTRSSQPRRSPCPQPQAAVGEQAFSSEAQLHTTVQQQAAYDVDNADPYSLPTSPQACDSEMHVLVEGLRKTLGVNRRRSGKAEQLFREWDLDDSGALSRKEFTQFVRQFRAITTDQEIDAAFRSADVNNDGFIELHEFTTWLTSNP